jgi:hypothetical protein
MSWFADLAGKAESLLEKVDNTAANVLQVDEKNFKDVPLDDSEQPVSDVGVPSKTDYDEPRISRTTSEASLLRKSSNIF